MPYQTPPTFSSGAILSSANLNIISQNIEFFWSLVSGVNTPFVGQTMVAGGESRYYTFRHTGRYLHYRARLTGGDMDELELLIANYGGANQDGMIDHSNHSNPYTWQDVIDLNALGDPPDIGEFYTVHYLVTFSGGGSEFMIDYLIESDSNVL